MQQITAKEVAAREGIGIKKARKIAKTGNLIMQLLSRLGCCEARRQLRYFSSKVADPCWRK